MAKDRVIGFIHDLVGDPRLNQQMFSTDRTPEAWVAKAEQNGYAFSADELKVVSEEIAQKPLPSENLIPDLLSALSTANGNGNSADAPEGTPENAFMFSGQGIARLKAVMQQGRYSGYYRPW